MQQYAQLVDQLPAIDRMGYVRTHRHGDTGVGKTLEGYLPICEW